MSDNTPLSQQYTPTHDEASRQAFVGALKNHVNGDLEVRLADLYERKLKPAYEQTNGSEPQHRDDIIPAFEADPMYQTWGNLVYTSQDLMWETVGDTVDRLQPAWRAQANARKASGKALGSLTLNPDLEIPKPIADIEIHRQPGNYFFEASDDDLTTAMLYMGTIELYRTAKGLGTGAQVGSPAMSYRIIQSIENRYPGFKPTRILDMGCAIGTETIGYKMHWPEAEVHGLDLSGAFVRFAHTWAEDQGVEMHYRQANAAETGYEDGQFDLIVSHIMFHETWDDVLEKAMKEAKRLLAPGGKFVVGDVPYQPSNIPMTKQVTNAWQVQNNGEPYWTGFADRDMKTDLVAAGFEADKVFADYEPLGKGVYYFFGGEA